MFELEVLNLLNEYKQGSEYKREKVKASLCALVAQHKEEYQELIAKGVLDNKAVELLSTCEIRSAPKDNSDDIEVIKKKYEDWLINYRAANNTPNEDCQRIIVDLINFYAPNRSKVLERLLSMKDTEEFESFKIMLMNYLRAYYAEKIQTYLASEEFEQLGYFAKKKKRSELMKVVDAMGNYKFSFKQIKEVLG